MTLPNPYLTPMPTPNQIPVWLTTLILFSRSHKGQTQPLYSKKIKFTGTMRFYFLRFLLRSNPYLITELIEY